MTKPSCPRCHTFKNVRHVPTEPGYNPQLEHLCCDSCKIGWFQLPHATNIRLGGTMAAARAAYVPPEKD